MTTSAHVRHRRNTSVDIELVKEETGLTKGFRLKDKWDMKTAAPPKRWALTDKEEGVYVRILQSKEGKKALNDLKNDKTNVAINDFVENIAEEIPRRKGAKLTALRAFLKELSKTPVKGDNTVAVSTLGITKRQIWKKFQELGLVEKYSKLKII